MGKWNEKRELERDYATKHNEQGVEQAAGGTFISMG